MKWFQHQSDASDDIKIKRLEYKFALQGYAIFFKMLEKVAKEGKNHRLDLKKYPLGFLSKEFNIKEDILIEYLTEMNNLCLLVFKNNEIYVPNMKKYTDNWSKRTTKKLPSNYGVATEQLPKEKNRIDKNRKEESICLILKNWNEKQNSPIPFFNPENIVNKYGIEKITNLIKTYGKINNGFGQFLSALKQ